jgi:hypothetical protein
MYEKPDPHPLHMLREVECPEQRARLAREWGIVDEFEREYPGAAAVGNGFHATLNRCAGFGSELAE